MDFFLPEIQIVKNYELAPSNIHGYGVISKIYIKKGDFINPHIIPKERYPFYKITQFGAFLNHSEKPNAISRKIKENLYLVYAIKDIFPGDEITLDYTVNKDLEQPQPWWKS